MRERFQFSWLSQRAVSRSLACGTCLLLASFANAQTGGGTGGGQATEGGGNDNSIGTGAIGDGGGLAAPELRSFGDTIDPTGGTGFAGRGNAAENFVGGGLQTGQGQAGGGRVQNQFQQLNRTQGQGARGQQPTGPSRAEMVRPRYRLGFSNPPIAASLVRSRLKTRMSPFGAQYSGMPGVEISLDDQGNATLTGTATSEHNAKLAAALARLEPSVGRVENKVQIAGAE